MDGNAPSPGFTIHDTAAWPAPDMSVLRSGRREPPALPLDVFGPEWSRWITTTAQAAAAPTDYVAAPLLAAASALVGNARWAQATPGWREPPHLWLACVGDSGTAKSSGADALMRDILPELERRMIGDHPERVREWRVAVEARNAQLEAWGRDVRTAQKGGNAPPLPPEGDEPPEPQQPRIRVSDVTVERVATLLARAAPKGLLVTRDELAGWLLGMTVYNDAGRSFWVEAYGGRSYRVERQKHPEPIHVERLAVAVAGSIQPDKLAGLFQEADDGLLARFLWSWPEATPFRLSRAAPGASWAIEALDRLRMLDLGADENGNRVPINVPLAEPAIAAMEAFGREMQQRQIAAGGLMRSTYGKARGMALRVSLVLAMLRWCGREGVEPPPKIINEDVFHAACDLVADYAMPMAARVFGDAAMPTSERDGATLARWIIANKAAEVHVRHMQRVVRLPGLGTADAIHAAALVLIEAGWLREPEKGSTFGPRRKAPYPVNPAVLTATL